MNDKIDHGNSLYSIGNIIMKIAWIFPRDKLCGISFYSHAYIEALRELVEIISIDPEDFRTDKKSMIDLLAQCSLVHIQYETSFFIDGGRDWYFDLCRLIKCPVIVTLHEVYDQMPGVFPRERLPGIFPIKKMREWLYDLRHPYLTALIKHTSAGYCARRILVHSGFQKDILVKKGIGPERIEILPVPVTVRAATPAKPWSGSGTLTLASTGFVSDAFDFELLFTTLEQCDLPWKFTWIGGVRREDDQGLWDRLHEEIRRRNWTERFFMTGIISKEKRDELLARTHVYCAFFSHKSSSESLATAIGARSMIVATPLPVTRELTKRFPVLLIANPAPPDLTAAIRRLATDEALQEMMRSALSAYCGEYGRERMAKRLAALYEQELIH
jgi:glycosyltransferase involved in cell wall biosynthesis